MARKWYYLCLLLLYIRGEFSFRFHFIIAASLSQLVTTLATQHGSRLSCLKLLLTSQHKGHTAAATYFSLFASLSINTSRRLLYLISVITLHWYRIAGLRSRGYCSPILFSIFVRVSWYFSFRGSASGLSRASQHADHFISFTIHYFSYMMPPPLIYISSRHSLIDIASWFSFTRQAPIATLARLLNMRQAQSSSQLLHFIRLLRPKMIISWFGDVFGELLLMILFRVRLARLGSVIYRYFDIS